jgi:hypothetical protein
MLTCVYHPIDPCRVVENDEADAMKATGVWFDCPNKAKAYRKKVESEIESEAQVKEPHKDKFKRKSR